MSAIKIKIQAIARQNQIIPKVILLNKKCKPALILATKKPKHIKIIFKIFNLFTLTPPIE